jgi:phosphoribosylamine--glycine ligase
MASVIMKKVMVPTLRGLRAEGIKYRGVLYAGLMIKDDTPYVLEFNCRLGDPETQPVLARLRSDLAETAMAITDGKLSEVNTQWRDEAAVCVVLASGGYPGSYSKGVPIEGLKEASSMEDVVVFHAGTAFNDDHTVTSGGRVLGVTALGRDIKAAKDRAYGAVDKIRFHGMHYRKDIAGKAIRRPT